MTYVFVSHSSKDDSAITELQAKLATHGITTFVDHLDIKDGDNWSQAVQDGLNNCDCCILALSPHSARSQECEAEYRRILSLGKKLYVALIADVAKADFPWRLGIIQYSNIHGKMDIALASLINVILGKQDLLVDDDSVETGKRITGFIRPELLDVPMTGRNKDLEIVKKHLSKYPTLIEGIGGLGKSRLAAAVVQDNDVSSAVWQVADEFASADDLLVLLREHFDLPIDADRRSVLDLVRQHMPLIVIDNAESISVERRQDYAHLIEEICHRGAHVLLTSRVAWSEIKLKRSHTPTQLSPEDAATVVVNMAQTFGVPYDLATKADEFAAAARLHPRLMEWGIRQMIDIFSPDEVIRELKALKSPEIEDALDEMIGVTLRQMTARHGADAEATLKKVNVFRGGFTLEAARSVTGLDDATLNSQLRILVPWQFVRRREDIVDQTRYEVEPLVFEVVGEDDSVFQAHYDYYIMLARDYDQLKYASLDIDSSNLDVAFERKIAINDINGAHWLATAAIPFLRNRGRFAQLMDWMLRIETIVPYQDDMELFAAVKINLGNAYSDLANITNRDLNLEKSAAAYNEVLHYYQPDVAPFDYAMIQNNLGNVYTDIASIGDSETNLKKAIDAYTEALIYYQPDLAPRDYAATQNNLGTAYCALADIIDLEFNLVNAITAFNEALKYRTSTAAPLEYAMTQNNLGNAYLELANVRDREINLSNAVAAFTKSLHFRTHAIAPLDYAMTQNNLGLVYRELSRIENKEANLDNAVDAYIEALRFRTPATAPLGHAMTQANLGVARKELGDIKAATDCWHEAEKYFRQVGAVKEADRMLQWIKGAEA